MTRLIYTYALIKSLYDQGGDYIDCFWPFAIKTFSEDKFSGLKTIQRQLKKQFDLKIPLHVLRSILDRAIEKDFITQKETEKKYKPTENGFEYLSRLETDKEVNRRINSLIGDLEKFFRKKNVSLTQEQIYDLLLSFLCGNIDPLIEFMNPSANISELSISKEVKDRERLLIQYIKLAERQKPEKYKILQDMVLGSVISVVLHVENTSDITEMRTKKFEHCQVFLDTNFAFFVLGLHSPEFNDPAKELFNLLKEFGFSLKIFDFTINEICKVISGYITKAHRYPASIKVNSLYSSLKRKGWRKTDAREFVMEIGNTLRRLEIAIERTDVDLKAYRPCNDGLRDRMSMWKGSQNTFHQNHDIAIIEKIKEFRKEPVRKLENAKVFFLTSDHKLSRFNFIGMGHKERGTVCEIILDRLLANVLWLKDPNVNPPLKSIIGTYSRDLFVNRRVWDKFYNALQTLKKEEKVDDKKLSMLFYQNYIEDALSGMDESDLDEITPDFALEEIEKASKLPEKRVKSKVKEKEKEFTEQLDKEISKKEKEKDEEWLEKIESIKKRLRKTSKKSAKKYILFFKGCYILIFSLPLVYCIINKEWDLFRNVATFLPLLIALIVGLMGPISTIWEKGEEYFTDKIHSKKIKEGGLEKL